jgi:3-oxoadipate enol-lactonase
MAMNGRARAGEIELNYVDVGEGEAVLFINGLSTDLQIWSMQLAEFSKDHRVILFDHRGTGLSDRPDGSYSMELLAEDVCNLLDALGVEQAHVVGHSMGGLVAQHVAIRHPARLKSLVLAATYARSPKKAHISFHLWADILEKLGVEAFVDLVIAQNYTHQYIERNWRQTMLMRRLLIDHLQKVPIDTAILRKQIQAVLDHDTEDRLARLRMPTLVVVGAQDTVVPPHLAKALAEKIPGAQFEIVPECAHNLMLERPEIFNTRVRSFIAVASHRTGGP